MTRQPACDRNCRVQVRPLFVGVYVLANLFAFGLSTMRGTIGGDFAGFPAPNTFEGFALVSAIASTYLLVLFPIFDGVCRWTRSRQTSLAPVEAQPHLHIGVLLLQIFLLTYSLTSEIGMAGRIVKSDNPIRFLVYFIPIDYIALIYIGIARATRIYKVNLLLYVASNVVRGWSSVFLFLFFVLLIRTRLLSRMTTLRWLGLGLLVLLTLPLAFGLRFYFRDYGGELTQASDVLALLQATENESGPFDIFLVLFGALIDRLQHYSSVVVEYTYLLQIRNLVSDGSIRPFIFDGPYFSAIYALLGTRVPFELNSMLTATFLGLDPSIEGYNTHSGLLGWLIITPEFAPLFLAYVLALGTTSTYLAQRLRSRWALDVTWLMWLILLMNGWFGGFVTFLVALGCVNLLQLGFVRKPTKSVQPRSCTHIRPLPNRI